MGRKSSSVTGRGALLATFYIRDALCALDATEVQEVIRLGPMTPVHHAPAEVLGIVNLRGRIVTILDVGRRLGFPPAAPGPESRVFIVEQRNECVGFFVDRAGEVVEIEDGQVEPPPSNVPREQSLCFRGVCRFGDAAMALIDLDRFLTESA